MSFFEGGAVGTLTPTTNSSIGTLVAASGVAVSHKQIGTQIKTTFTLTAMPQTVVNGTEHQGTQLWTFPKGEIRIEAAEASLTQTTTSDPTTTLNAGVVGAVGVGTATSSSTTLATTMQNIIPTTAFNSSTVIATAGTTVTAILGTGVYGDAFLLNGITSPISVYFNSAYATTGDVDANATQTWTGTVTVTWSFLGGPYPFFEDDSIGRQNMVTNTNIGTVVASGVTVAHKQIGALIKTTLTLTAVAQTIVNGVEYQGTKLWTMPEGQIRIEYAGTTLTETTLGTLASSLHASSAGILAVGTTTASTAASLTTTVANIIPQTAWTSSAVTAVAGSPVSAILGTGVYANAFQLDGNTTAVSVFLNSAIPSTGDVTGDASITWTGQIVIVWAYLGGTQAII